jgi:hypothetical protein
MATKPKNKGGRPKKVIDQEEFEKLCGMQCTKAEICDWFNLTDKTLERWCKETYKIGFSEVFQKKRIKGKIALRRNLLNMSSNNAAVVIFLAKNWLGMRDKIDVDSESKPQPVTVNIQVEDGRRT